MMTVARCAPDSRAVSVTAALHEDEALPGRDAVVEALVARLHEEFGVDAEQLRRMAVEVLGSFATARVQTFVPILVEKRLRETCRGSRRR